MGGVIGVILLDETVVAVALPTIQRDLGLSVVGSHWVINVYLLFLAGLAAAAGRLSDIIGIKILFLTGLVVFGLASLAAGLAQDGAWIIIARGVQGVGAAVIFPVSMAIVTIAFPPEQRGYALGIYGAIGTSFLALGPLVGGAFTDFLSWRWIFWINPPIVLVICAIVLIQWTDPPQRPSSARFDGVGLLTLVGGLGMIIFAVMQSADWGWSDPAIWLVLVTGSVLLAVFAVYEYRSKAPLIEVDLFTNGTVSASNFVLFTAQFIKITVVVFGALYFQRALGYSAFLAGVALLPAVAIQPFAAIPSGRIADRFEARTLTLIGLSVAALSLIWMGIATAWHNYLIILPSLLCWAAVMGLVFLPPLRAVHNAVQIDKQGQASGIAMSSQLLGGTVGMAVSSALYAVTDEFGIVFIASGILALAALAVTWLAIRPDEPRGT